MQLRSPRRRSSSGRLLGWAKAAVVLASTLVVALTGFAWNTYRQVSSGISGSNALVGARSSSDGATNILLIGLDTRLDQNGDPLPPAILSQLHAGDGSVGGYNTNTLILLHVPADGEQASAFSIPRDDLVPIPGYHTDKIKQAYGVAKFQAEEQLHNQGVTDRVRLERQGREAGRRATLEVVQALLGVPIDHFAEITLAGFYDLASALGGVQVCLNHPVADAYSGADFPAGRQTLDGAQALAFVRQRHGLPNGDLDRTHRQQAFLASAAHQLTSLGTFTHPRQLQNLIDVAKRDVVIDTGWDVLSFAEQAHNLAEGNVAFYTLPIQGYVRTPSGEDANRIDPTRVQAFIHTHIDSTSTDPSPVAPAPPPVTPGAARVAGVVIDVRNGSGRDGLADQTAQAMAAAGYHPGTLTNAPSHSHTILAYPPGDQAAAAQLAALLGGLPTTVDPTLPPRHLRVDLGTAFTLPTTRTPTPTTSPSPQPVSPTIPSPEPGPAGNPVTGGDIPCVD